LHQSELFRASGSEARRNELKKMFSQRRCPCCGFSADSLPERTALRTHPML
ncbi:hypothetical protein M9458_047234, partial [Cirrhinus mrigala]